VKLTGVYECRSLVRFLRLNQACPIAESGHGGLPQNLLRSGVHAGRLSKIASAASPAATMSGRRTQQSTSCHSHACPQRLPEPKPTGPRFSGDFFHRPRFENSVTRSSFHSHCSPDFLDCGSGQSRPMGSTDRRAQMSPAFPQAISSLLCTSWSQPGPCSPPPHTAFHRTRERSGVLPATFRHPPRISACRNRFAAANPVVAVVHG